MSALLLPSYTIARPSAGVQVDRSQSLANRLVSFVGALDEGPRETDLVAWDRVAPLTERWSRVATPYGTALRQVPSTSNNGLVFSRGASIPTGSDWTFWFWGVRRARIGGSGHPGLIRSITATASGTTFVIFYNETGRPWLRVNGTNLTTDDGAETPLDTPFQMVMRFRSNVSWEFFVDGLPFKNGSAVGTTTPSLTGGNGFAYLGAHSNRTAPGEALNGDIYGAALWSRAITDGEIAELASNPLALLADPWQGIDPTYFGSESGPPPPDPLAAGTASFVSSGPAGISVEANAPTDGVEPYSYQWERNQDGGSYSDLSGATSLTLDDTTATTGGVLYGYRCKQTDSADPADTVTTNAVTAEVYDGGALGGGGVIRRAFQPIFGG